MLELFVYFFISRNVFLHIVVILFDAYAFRIIIVFLLDFNHYIMSLFMVIFLLWKLFAVNVATPAFLINIFMLNLSILLPTLTLL